MAKTNANERAEKGFVMNPYNMRGRGLPIIEIVDDSIAINVNPRQFAVSTPEDRWKQFFDTYGIGPCYALVAIDNRRKVLLAHLDTEINLPPSLDSITGEFSDLSHLGVWLFGGNESEASKDLLEGILKYYHSLGLNPLTLYCSNPLNSNPIRNVAVDVRSGVIYEAIGGDRVYTGTQNSSYIDGISGKIEKINRDQNVKAS